MHCKVTEQLFDIFRLLEDEQKKPKDYGGGISLSYSEVMFLKVVARFPRENVSGLSARLMITKGAVTQMSGKLLAKGMIEMHRQENNKKEKYFSLSPAGAHSVEGYQQFHMEANKRLCAFLTTLTPKEIATIFRFLDELKQCAPFCEFQCGNGDSMKEDNYDESGITGCAGLTGGTGVRP